MRPGLAKYTPPTEEQLKFQKEYGEYMAAYWGPSDPLLARPFGKHDDYIKDPEPIIVDANAPAPSDADGAPRS